jgi:hypothetical protein
MLVLLSIEKQSNPFRHQENTRMVKGGTKTRKTDVACHVRKDAEMKVNRAISVGCTRITFLPGS